MVDNLPEFPPSDLMNAFMQGGKDCANGLSYDENPYPDCTPYNSEWSRGWIDIDSYTMLIKKNNWV